MDSFTSRLMASAHKVEAANYRYKTGPALMEAVSKIFPDAKFEDESDLKHFQDPMPFTKIIIKRFHAQDESKLQKADLHSYLIEPYGSGKLLVHVAQGQPRKW